MSADLQYIAGAVKPYRTGHSLDIDATTLGTLGYKYLHKPMQQIVLKKTSQAGRYPISHVFLWRAKNAFYLMSPHQSIALMSRDLTAKIGSRYFCTLDSDIHRLVGDPSAISTVTMLDDCYVLEVSPKQLRSGNMSYTKSLNEYTAHMHPIFSDKVHMSLAKKLISFPICADSSNKDHIWEKRELERNHREIIKGLERHISGN